MANHLHDLIDEELSISLKHQAMVMLQTHDYIKVSCQTYVETIDKKHQATWMNDIHITVNRPTPLPTVPTFHKSLHQAVGDPDQKAHEALKRNMGFGYRNRLGELIYAMVTCRPDLSYAIVMCAQASTCPVLLINTSMMFDTATTM